MTAPAQDAPTGLRIIVLGAAAGGGFPQWNSAGPGCRRARTGDPAVPAATQASIAISADDRHWFIVNAAPDLRAQIQATPALHPQPPAGQLRHSPIAGVVLTNGDVDAVAGLLHLRERTAFGLFAHPRVLRVLTENPIFGVLDPALVPRRALALDLPQALPLPDGTPSGLTITPFAVPGKVALYLEDPAAPGFGSAPGDVIGLQISRVDHPGRALFIGNCAAVTPEIRARIDGADLLLFDGTLWDDDEMIRAGVGTKTGQRMGHIAMAGPDGSMARLAGLRLGRRMFLHINNTNPTLDRQSRERAEAASLGWEIAEDGMKVILP